MILDWPPCDQGKDKNKVERTNINLNFGQRKSIQSLNVKKCYEQSTKRVKFNQLLFQSNEQN